MRRAYGSESERRFRDLFEASPVGIALTDEQARFVEVNPAWSRLLGRPRESLIVHLGTEFTHPDALTQPGESNGVLEGRNRVVGAMDRRDGPVG